AEDGIRDPLVTGVQTCALPIYELFDVFDDQFRANEMGDVGPAFWVVHGVGQVAHEHDVLAVFGHLPQTERPTQNAHVGVYAHENHVLDTAVFQQTPDLHARVADGVFILNLQKIDLGLPGRLRIAPHAGQSLVPLL